MLVPAEQPVVLEHAELMSTQTSLVVLNTMRQVIVAIETSALQEGPIVGEKTWSVGRITLKKPPAGTGLTVLKVIL
jgi:hypothetical protein